LAADRFRADVLDAEGAELFPGPLFGPTVGRVTGPADTVSEDLFDPREDPFFGGDAAIVHLGVPRR
jgi:hypothetical protein